MKRTILFILLCILLAGCGRQTQVWLPEEEVVELQGKDVVRIPMGEETEPAPAEPTLAAVQASEPESTEPVIAGKTTISKKPTTTAKKNTTTGTATNKDTISATEKPAVTEPSVTEPPATEPPMTEPPVTEPPATEPPVTEPPATEPPATEPPLYNIDDYQLGNLEYEMFDRINEYRMDADLDLLWMDTWLSAIASCRSYEANQVWSHTRPDGRHFSTVLDDYGYGAYTVQELLVYDTGSGDGIAMVDRWMQSNTQRELLLGDFTTAGIGVYRADGVTYVTCLLAN